MVAIIKHLPDPHLWEKNWQAMHVQYFKKAATNNLVKVVFFKTAFHCDKNNIYKHFHIYSFQIQIKRIRNTIFDTGLSRLRHRMLFTFAKFWTWIYIFIELKHLMGIALGSNLRKGHYNVPKCLIFFSCFDTFDFMHIFFL